VYVVIDKAKLVIDTWLGNGENTPWHGQFFRQQSPQNVPGPRQSQGS